MKKLKKDIFGLTTTGILTGIGSMAIDKAGGSSAGLSSVNDFMPIMGTMVGSGAAIRQLNEFKPKKRKR